MKYIFINIAISAMSLFLPGAKKNLQACQPMQMKFSG
jgi:hypothetical protein